MKHMDLTKLTDEELITKLCCNIARDDISNKANKPLITEILRRMSRPLRFRLERATGAYIWYGELLDTDGVRTSCNSGPIKFMEYKKADIKEKCSRFAERLGLTAEFVEPTDQKGTD